MSQPERDQLAGMPAVLMMQLQARLETRLGDRCALEADRKQLAQWMLHRLMEKRMNDGRQLVVVQFEIHGACDQSRIGG